MEENLGNQKRIYLLKLKTLAMIILNQIEAIACRRVERVLLGSIAEGITHIYAEKVQAELT